jgi:hypothetical protein
MVNAQETIDVYAEHPGLQKLKTQIDLQDRLKRQLRYRTSTNL